jgi:hypothetical protein
VTSPLTGRITPAGVVRMVLGSVFRRRSVLAPGPDFGLPARPTPPAVVPNLHDAEQRVGVVVDELAARGALDEGHGDAFDPLVDALVEMWDRGVTEYRRAHLDHLARLERTEIDLLTTGEWVRRRAAAAAETVAELDAEIDTWLTAADRTER